MGCAPATPVVQRIESSTTEQYTANCWLLRAKSRLRRVAAAFEA